MKLAGAAVLVLLAFAACSKSNNVTRSERDLSTDNIGEACDANDAGFCGGGVCIAGRCRQKCGTDAECSGNICFGGGRWGAGRLPPRRRSCLLDGEPCSTALLTCALDESCRIPCSDALPCPRNDQKCIAGSCFGSLEEGDKPWECETGSFRCSDDGKLEQCNTVGVGFVEIEVCETRELCDDVGASADNGNATPAPHAARGGSSSTATRPGTSPWWMRSARQKRCASKLWPMSWEPVRSLPVSRVTRAASRASSSPAEKIAPASDEEVCAAPACVSWASPRGNVRMPSARQARCSARGPSCGAATGPGLAPRSWTPA